MTKTEITKRVVHQGSYGIYKTNPRNGRWLGPVMLVWHAKLDGKYIGTFRTRAAAREAVRELAASG